MKPFLVLQLRPEREAADEEFAAFLERGQLREAQVRRIRLDEAPMPALSLDDYAGIIVGGGPGCVSDAPEDKDPLEARIEADILSLMPEVLARDMPFMGCCYGMGILGHTLGGTVAKGRYGEPIGGVDCTLTEHGATDPILADLPRDFRALVGHKEAVEDLPQGATHLVASGPCPFQMIRAGRNVYATQFHPEAKGENFANRIRIYRDRGYFDPADAEALTAACLAERVSVPERILSNFTRRFGG
ncbi:glutamine amidotransferase class-I [Roseibacterium elongatum DSM 19469]|uniref:Glutamine amidotransferase class-I n=1 Tax=Roseicyclus elongatus DSM 19469 TaxID=1294273 RepID=W8SSU6_9RHOB|nr:glutamine amidotransferase [Roseibacterium elongatum]AHM05600.1 glutamine amidotransferase class-I [Roseibacterium elongatum DSM 19469]